jgi:hypothetical protein
MHRPLEVGNPQLFAMAVRKKLIAPQDGIGLRVRHIVHGVGEILDVRPAQQTYHIRIRFLNLPRAQREKVFISQVFHSGDIADMELPAHIEARVWADLARELLARHAAPTEAPEADGTKTLTDSQTAQAQQEKWEAFREQKAKEIYANMQAERRRAEEDFALLATYYLHRTGLQRIAYDGVLHTVLRMLASPKGLSIPEARFIEQTLPLLGRQRAAISAACFELLSAHTHNRHYLPTACHYWREADLPERVLEIAVPSDQDSAGLRAALLNTRSAALADMENWSEARQTAARAARANPGSAHTFNVLGRIGRATGTADRGQAYFTQAQHSTAARHTPISTKDSFPHENENTEQ